MLNTLSSLLRTVRGSERGAQMKAPERALLDVLAQAAEEQEAADAAARAKATGGANGGPLVVGEERARLAAEVAEAGGPLAHRRAVLLHAIQRAEAARDAAMAELVRAHGELEAFEAGDVADYVRLRDERWRVLRDGAPPLVLELVARLEAEAHATKPERVTLAKTDPYRLATGHDPGEHVLRADEVVSNADGRRRGLRDLAERIRRSAECGTDWTTEDELRRWFEAEYAKVPPVEPIRERLAKLSDPRARKLMLTMAAAPSFPPAAA